jgi:type II secretory pathway pseudopilin PulG
MVVAVGLFAIVMTICVDVLLSLVNADRKAQALQSVMNNLNIALDGMVRNIREGTTFHCGSGALTTTQDCSSTTDDPGNHYLFAFEPYGKSASNTPPDPPTIYLYNATDQRLYRSVDGNPSDAVAITAPEVSIDSLQFYVVGTAHGNGDTVQPKVVIVIKGTAGTAGTAERTTFHIQATAVQRQLDL